MQLLKVGTRGSALAQAQANEVRRALEAAQPGLNCELVVIRTSGDDFSAGRPFDSAGHPELVEGDRLAQGERTLKGLFVKELEEALLNGRVDLAVHSVKDLETDLPEGLTLAAIPPRQDPRDAVVSRGGDGAALANLPAGAKVGVSSLRRQAQLRRLRGDLEYLPVRGNVDTRLRKLDAGECEALVLAAAGLIRLGLEKRIRERLSLDRCLPAPGQGALGVEIRADRRDLVELLKTVDDPASRQEVEAERHFLKAMGGSCRVPVGALARAAEGKLTLEGVVLSPDGRKAIREKVSGPVKAAERLGRELASHLRAAGADRLLFGAWERRHPRESEDQGFPPSIGSRAGFPRE